MLDPVADVLDDRPVLFKEKINFKLPGGGGFAPHQDIQPVTLRLEEQANRDVIRDVVRGGPVGQNQINRDQV